MTGGDPTSSARIGRTDGPSLQQVDAVVRVVMSRYADAKDDADQAVTIAAALGIDLAEVQARWAAETAA